MSTSTNSFLDQKNTAATRHPAQRAHEMDDQEKIHHLKQEIDNLRNQLREANGGSINRPSATSSTTSTESGSVFDFFSGSMVAMVVLLLAVLVVVRRMRNNKRGYRYAAGSMMMMNRSPELTMTFELQDAHDYAIAPPPASEPRDLSYAAPSSSQIQFV